jgi:citrate/tricarballylate utilization protein
MDAALILLLFLTRLSGLVLLAFRAAPAMGTLLAIHLGIVLGLFLTLPYGKFVHAVHRLAALVRHAGERHGGGAVQDARVPVLPGRAPPG